MKTSYSKAPAIVVGLGQNGLATVRSLARQGIPVIAVCTNLQQYTTRTRYCEKILCRDFRIDPGLIKTLFDLGRNLPCKGVLFPSGDNGLHIVSENREQLEDYFHFTFPSKQIVRLTLDKKKFYQFAQINDLNIPQTFFPEGTHEIRRIAEYVNYPCIIKPYQPNLGWRQRFPGQKLFTVHSKDELMQLYNKLVLVHDDLIVQELIGGDDSKLSFSLTYLDGSSQPLGMFTGRKLRQYPPQFGTSSMAESHYDVRIADETVRILKLMEYTGYGSVEFKWDERSQEFKVIEVTARTWFPHGIATFCGLNLEHIAYCHSLGLPVPAANGFREGVKWIHEERDLRSSFFYLSTGKLGIKEWMRSYLGQRTYAISAWDDPVPGMSMVSKVLTAPLRRLYRSQSVTS